MCRINPQAYLADVLSRPIWLMSSIASLITRSVRSTLCSHGAGQNSARQVAATNQKPRPTADAHGIGTIAGVCREVTRSPAGGAPRRWSMLCQRSTITRNAPGRSWARSRRSLMRFWPRIAKHRASSGIPRVGCIVASWRNSSWQLAHVPDGASAVWFWSGDNLGV